MNSRHLNRRKFLKETAAMMSAGPLGEESTRPAASSTSVASSLRLQAGLAPSQTVWIMVKPNAGFQERLAARELAKGLRNLGLAREPIQAALREAQPAAPDTVFTLQVEAGKFQHPEAYEIAQEAGTNSTRLRLTGSSPQAVLYAVFDLIERQQALFGLDGEIYPLEKSTAFQLPRVGEPWRAQPRFNVRGLVPWPDFLNCITVFNREDFRAYLEAMLRMRFNTLGIHVYSGINQWTESFLAFEYGKTGHLAFTDTTATHRWGYLPQRTSRFGMGAADFYDTDVFGSEATTNAQDCWEAAKFARQLWREALEYAQKLGIRTGVGFEPYSIPDEIFRATPPEARLEQKDPNLPGPRLDPDSVAARDILETRLGELLDAYPMVDYVWLWEDEGMSWASQKTGVPLSTTPFKQAHDFLRRHAPKKRLVISGWGGVVRHFVAFHRALPEDIIFSSLSDDLGWDPVSEEFSKLEGRERWPIPWLEDDPAMWLPQFHVHRFESDMNRAEQFGCQGLLGIHWRHRIMDIDAGYQARFSWDKDLKPDAYFQAYSRALVRQPAADKVAEILTGTDRDRLILCSSTGEFKDGHAQVHEYTGDYSEAFNYWNDYEPSQDLKESQKKVGESLRALTTAPETLEGERLNYITRHIEFMTPYSESWSLAHHLDRVLKQATVLKKAGKVSEARDKVQAEAVPLWLKLAPLVREVFLDFQEIVSTRNDLGSLASMHNKYERLALFRLRASMKEFLVELPRETEDLYAEVIKPDANARPRVFVPTRPSVLFKGDRVRVMAVSPGGKGVTRVRLFTRAAGAPAWTESAMKLRGRRTYEAEITAQAQAGILMDFYVEATFSGPSKSITAPLEAPKHFYTVTLA